jgi:hypothetical protein
MQISTRDTDYIIDTLLLRDKLYCLNEVFTKPSIVKVSLMFEDKITPLPTHHALKTCRGNGSKAGKRVLVLEMVMKKGIFIAPACLNTVIH